MLKPLTPIDMALKTKADPVHWWPLISTAIILGGLSIVTGLYLSYLYLKYH